MMSTRLLSFLFIIPALIHWQTALSQLPNETFYDLAHRDSFLPERFENKGFLQSLKPLNKIGKQVYIDFQTLFFCRNNEYFSNIDAGETLFGYQFMPSLVWKPFAEHNLHLKGGVFLQRNFGENSFAKTQPTFTLDYKLNNTRLVFGTLYGGLEHRLIEPLYRFERGLNNRLENGLQVIHSGKRLWFDTWINWRQTTLADSNRQEILEGGFSGFYRFVGTEKSPFQGKLITQLTALHQGGSFVEQPLINRSNAALGFDFRYGNKESIEWTFQPYFLQSIDHSIIIQQPYKNGTGIYLNGGFTRNNFTFMTSYWKGWEYASPFGTPLYGSFSYQNFYSMERERELLFFRFIYARPLIANNLITDLRFEPLFDLINTKFHYSLGIYFIYRMGI